MNSRLNLSSKQQEKKKQESEIKEQREDKQQEKKHHSRYKSTKKDLDDLQKRLDNNALDVNQQDAEGNTMLILAVKRKDLALINFLLENGAKYKLNLNIKNKCNKTALFYVSNADVFDNLVAKGADFIFEDLLKNAIRCRSMAMVRFLLKKKIDEMKKNEKDSDQLMLNLKKELSTKEYDPGVITKCREIIEQLLKEEEDGLKIKCDDFGMMSSGEIALSPLLLQEPEELISDRRTSKKDASPYSFSTNPMIAFPAKSQKCNKQELNELELNELELQLTNSRHNVRL